MRERVGIFDVSHLGKASVTGEGALEFLNSIFTNDLNRISDGQAQYTLLCNPQGGVIDDLIVYRNSATDFFLVPNASNTTDVVKDLQAQAPSTITIENLHEAYGVIALQGPLATAVLKSLGVLADLEYMAFSHVTIGTASALLCRTGYTGEHGFEIIPAKKMSNRSGMHSPLKFFVSKERSVDLVRAIRCEQRWVIHYMGTNFHFRFPQSKQVQHGLSVGRKAHFKEVMF